MEGYDKQTHRVRSLLEQGRPWAAFWFAMMPRAWEWATAAILLLAMLLLKKP